MAASGGAQRLGLGQHVPLQPVSRPGGRLAQRWHCPSMYWTRDTHISLPDEQPVAVCPGDSPGSPTSLQEYLYKAKSALPGRGAEDTGNDSPSPAACPEVAACGDQLCPGRHLCCGPVAAAFSALSPGHCPPPQDLQPPTPCNTATWAFARLLPPLSPPCLMLD